MTVSFNGNGLFLINSAGQPVNAQTLIEASVFNTLTSDLAAGLTNTICRDGQSTIIANLPMSGYRHTGVGNAVGRTDYAAAGQVQDGTLNWVAGGGTADAITATYNPSITTLSNGQLCFVRATAANATTTPTFSPNGLAARTIVKKGGTALVAGDISGTGHELALRYDLANTRWELLNPGSYAGLGTNTFTGIQRWAKGADVASAAALILGVDGNYFDITGTATITSIGTAGAGTWVKLHFDAALTLTHHATNLILPGGANITTAAGDEAEFVEYATGQWRCTNYAKATGQAVVAPTVEGIKTGSAFDYIGSTAPDGYVLLDGKTIGNAASGATERANADTEALFVMLWNSMTNAMAPVSGGRGASAAADFAANKTITLPDARGRVIAGRDDMGGTTASRITAGLSGVDGTVLGTWGGTEVVSLTSANNGPHTHSQQSNTMLSNGYATFATAQKTGTAVVPYIEGGTTASSGSGTPHQNLPPILILNKIVKL